MEMLYFIYWKFFLARTLSILLIFSKNLLLTLITFLVVCLFYFKVFISSLYYLFCFSFVSSLSSKLNPLIWPFFFSEISIQNYKFFSKHWVSFIYILWSEKVMAPHSSTLTWKIPWTEEPGRLQSMGSRRVGHDFTFTFTFHFHALEKEMATHSSVLAWRIPGMGEPGGLPSMGSHWVRHDWSDLAAAAAAAHTLISYIFTIILFKIVSSFSYDFFFDP